MAIKVSSIFLTNWKEEKNSAFLYRYAALAEQGTIRESLFNRLADSAEAQASIWAQKLLKSDISLPDFQPNLRTKVVAWLILRLGIKSIKPVLAAMKIRGLSVYLGEMPGHPVKERNMQIELESQHQTIKNGGILRAAVFGINDGLISNASLILGFAGASSNTNLLILSGIAGLFAGAFSMAAGEYISMRAQRELYEYQIGLERAELDQYPEEEAAELSIIYQARGLSKIDADIFAEKILSNPTTALNTLARDELGLNPEELGSPWSAAFSSFFAFALGGMVPLLPFLISPSSYSLNISIAVTGVALFSVGIILSLFTGKNAFYSGLRMLTVGMLAGTVTFVIGKIVGVHIN